MDGLMDGVKITERNIWHDDPGVDRHSLEATK